MPGFPVGAAPELSERSGDIAEPVKPAVWSRAGPPGVVPGVNVLGG